MLLTKPLCYELNLCVPPLCDSGAEQEVVNAVVFLFTRTYLHRLMVSDDTEFYEEQVTF